MQEQVYTFHLITCRVLGGPHNPTAYDYDSFIPVEEQLEALERLVRDGKVRKVSRCPCHVSSDTIDRSHSQK